MKRKELPGARSKEKETGGSDGLSAKIEEGEEGVGGRWVAFTARRSHKEFIAKEQRELLHTSSAPYSSSSCAYKQPSIAVIAVRDAKKKRA